MLLVKGDGIKTQSTTGRSFGNGYPNPSILLLITIPSLIEAPPLPEDWVTVRHASGINLYLHKSTRTLTLSRPYAIPESKAIKVSAYVSNHRYSMKYLLMYLNPQTLGPETSTLTARLTGTCSQLTIPFCGYN